MSEFESLISRIQADAGKSTCELAEGFYQLVKSSGVFPYMGVTKSQGPFGESEVDVFMAENYEAVLARPQEFSNALDAFDSLSRSLEPEVSVYLHLIREQDLPDNDLQRMLEDSSSQISLRRELLYSERMNGNIT
jgi:hypothetical protein